MANHPADLKYTKDHEWARVEGELVRIGITQYAVEQLGDVTLVDLPRPGTKFAAAGQFGAVESVKAVSELFAPLSGEVVEANDALAQKPELVNDAPYGDGWMLVVRPSSPAELEKLMDASAYESFLGSLSA
jgi:glycine cleavage system H protein